jgi:hypothetical protein
MLTSLWNQFGIKKEEDSSDDDDDMDMNEPLNTTRNSRNNSQHPPPSSSSDPSDSNPGPFKTFHPPSFLRTNSMGNNTNVEDAEAAACFHRFPEYGSFTATMGRHYDHYNRLNQPPSTILEHETGFKDFEQQQQEEEEGQEQGTSSVLFLTSGSNRGGAQNTIESEHLYQNHKRTTTFTTNTQSTNTQSSSSLLVHTSNSFLDDIIPLNNIKDTLDIFNLLKYQHESPPSLSSSPPSSPLSMTHPSSWNPYNDGRRMTLSSTYSHSGGVGVVVTNPSRSKDDTMDVWNDEEANVWKDDKNDTTITTATTHSNTNEKNMNHPTETSTSILSSSTMDHFQTRKQSTSFYSTDGTTTSLSHFHPNPQEHYQQYQQPQYQPQEYPSWNTTLHHPQMISHPPSTRQIYDEKSHWMPDVLCKHCYACESQFTMFRRRHHCRLCGQVFCSRCSSFFVEIVGGKIHTQLKEVEDGSMMGTTRFQSYTKGPR